MTHLEPFLGGNRTGIQMSPIMSSAMIDAVRQFPWEKMPTTSESSEELRKEFIKNADSVGSIPIPLTLKDMARTGYEMLKGGHPEVFIDRLGERQG